MIAFHGDPTLKSGILAQLSWHRTATLLAETTALCGPPHAYPSDWGPAETAAGIPTQLAHLEDYLHNNLPDPDYIVWPERFWTAINPGADLEMVVPRFVRWLLDDALRLVEKHDLKLLTIYQQIILLYSAWADGQKPADAPWATVADIDALTDSAARSYSSPRYRADLPAAALATRAAIAAIAALVPASHAASGTLAIIAARPDRDDCARPDPVDAACADLAAIAILAARADGAETLRRSGRMWWEPADLQHCDAAAFMPALSDRTARAKCGQVQAAKLIQLLMEAVCRSTETV